MWWVNSIWLSLKAVIDGPLGNCRNEEAERTYPKGTWNGKNVGVRSRVGSQRGKLGSAPALREGQMRGQCILSRTWDCYVSKYHTTYL
jgi:hypothetical protein